MLTDEALVVINVNDINEAPVLEGTPYTFNIDEHNNGATLATIMASDVDVDDMAQVLTYEITNESVVGAFVIDANTGVITVNADLEHDNYLPNGIVTFDVIVHDHAGDAADLTDTEIVTVTINHVNDAPVFGLENYIFDIDENSANGTSVSTVTASDANTANHGDVITYTLKEATVAGVFEINPTTGEITVADNTNMNHETNELISFIVVATDNGTPNLFDESLVVVNLTDVNEAPEFGVAAYSFDIDENSVNGTTVNGAPVITATDVDLPQQVLTFSIEMQVLLGFAINSGNW